ncbi:MAG: extracellular solute-binding protein [Acetobacteraceae bacterium]|nr:extracellular solute-binding protein [Acetobacteraceae bacterium]
MNMACRPLLRRTLLTGVAGLGCWFTIGPARAQALDALVPAARKEGRVMAYSVIDPTLMQKVIAAFQQRYGVAVDQQRMLTNPLGQRLEAESKAQQTVADLFITTDPLFIRDAAAQGWVAPVETIPGVDTFPAEVRTQYSIVVGHVPYSLVWNTKRAKAPPHAWPDLAASQWQGARMMIDPRVGGVSPLSWYVLMRQTYGDGFITEIGKGTRYTPSVVPGLQQIAAGAMAVYAPGIHQVFVGLAAKSAPIQEAFPNPTISSDNIMALLAHAPHPNAARLFAGFLMSREGQSLLNMDGFSPLPNVPGTRPLPQLARIAPETVNPQLPQISALLGLG